MTSVGFSLVEHQPIDAGHSRSMSLAIDNPLHILIVRDDHDITNRSCEKMSPML